MKLKRNRKSPPIAVAVVVQALWFSMIVVEALMKNAPEEVAVHVQALRFQILVVIIVVVEMPRKPLIVTDL